MRCTYPCGNSHWFWCFIIYTYKIEPSNIVRNRSNILIAYRIGNGKTCNVSLTYTYRETRGPLTLREDKVGQSIDNISIDSSDIWFICLLFHAQNLFSLNVLTKRPVKCWSISMHKAIAKNWIFAYWYKILTGWGLYFANMDVCTKFQLKSCASILLNTTWSQERIIYSSIIILLPASFSMKTLSSLTYCIWIQIGVFYWGNFLECYFSVLSRVIVGCHCTLLLAYQVQKNESVHIVLLIVSNKSTSDLISEKLKEANIP